MVMKKKAPVEKREPKKEEGREAKMPPFMRKAVEKKEAGKPMPKKRKC